MASRDSLDKARRRTNAEARRALLRERGVTLADLAATLGCGAPLLSQVNGGSKRSRRIERAIAERLGLPLTKAFPEWYRNDKRVA